MFGELGWQMRLWSKVIREAVMLRATILLLPQEYAVAGIIQAAEAAGAPLRHVANTATLLRFPQMALDLVRVGAGLYGFGVGAAAGYYPGAAEGAGSDASCSKAPTAPLPVAAACACACCVCCAGGACCGCCGAGGACWRCW